LAYVFFNYYMNACVKVPTVILFLFLRQLLALHPVFSALLLLFVFLPVLYASQAPLPSILACDIFSYAMLHPIDVLRFPALRKPLLLSLFLTQHVTHDGRFPLNMLGAAAYCTVITRNGPAHS